MTVAQLRAAGVSHEGIKWRQAKGRLFRIHRGVYAVGHAALTDRGRWKAATLALGPRAVLSHRSAAELWALLAPGGGAPHVTLPYPASPARRAGLNVHRSRTLPRERISSRDNVPVTMPARTLADLARVATPAEVSRATREAEARGLPLAADHVSRRTESDLEGDFFALCARFARPFAMTATATSSSSCAASPSSASTTAGSPTTRPGSPATCSPCSRKPPHKIDPWRRTAQPNRAMRSS